MKSLIFSLLLVCFCFLANAQVFGPKALPSGGLKLGATTTAVTKNFFRPLVSVATTFSDGTQLGGGFGFSFQHDKFDTPSNSYAIMYAASLVAFVTTNGNSIGGTGALLISIPGTNGIVTLGPGYDFTNKKVVLATAAMINL